MERRVPSFARDFPASPELDALVDTFARGDYASVRANAPKLAASTQDEAVRRAAQTLVLRTRPDPGALTLVVLTAILLAAMTGYWVANAHAPPGAAPPKPTVERPHPARPPPPAPASAPPPAGS